MCMLCACDSVSYPASAGPTIHLGHSLKMTDRSAAIFTTAFSSKQ